MPDVEALVIGWLSSRSELAGAFVSSVVPTYFPDGARYDGTQSIVRVVRMGGGIDNSLPFYLDHARLDLDCFAKDKATAHDLMAQVRALFLRDLRAADVSSFATASIRDTTEFVGPQWFDEPDYSPAGRYLLQVGVSVHPY